MLSVSDPWVVLVLTLVLFRFIGFGESGACFGTGSEFVPWGHANGPSERRIRPAFLKARALDGTAVNHATEQTLPSYCHLLGRSRPMKRQLEISLGP